MTTPERLALAACEPSAARDMRPAVVPLRQRPAVEPPLDAAHTNQSSPEYAPGPGSSPFTVTRCRGPT